MALVLASILLIVVGISTNDVFAMGDNPSTCFNRYDGTIVSFIVNNGTHIFDPLANPGLNFNIYKGSVFDVAFVIQTPDMNSNGNSDLGTTWYRENVNGYGNGHCVPNRTSATIGPNQYVSFASPIPWRYTALSSYNYQFSTWGSGVSFTVNFVDTDKPTNLSATPMSSSQIDLSWDTMIPADPTITGYRIDRSSDSGQTWNTIVFHTNSANTTYSDVGLANSTTYAYRVFAWTTMTARSEPSNIAFATTFDTPPSLLSLTVSSVDVLNNPLDGIWVQLQSANGNIIVEGFTPITFNVNQGTQYTVSTNNYMQHVFLYWEDGSVDSTRDITPIENIAMTATYTITTADQIVP